MYFDEGFRKRASIDSIIQYILTGDYKITENKCYEPLDKCFQRLDGQHALQLEELRKRILEMDWSGMDQQSIDVAYEEMADDLERTQDALNVLFFKAGLWAGSKIASQLNM